jgi:5-methylcytosine-specific restriction enzyme A
MARAMGVCSTPGCAELVPVGESRCTGCAVEAERGRGTPRQRGYNRRHDQRFRRGVLRKNPLCVCTDLAHGHAAPCLSPSRHADHWPRTKRDLRRLRLDEHDPQYGRGLCAPCHSKHTAAESPGGWNAR